MSVGRVFVGLDDLYRSDRALTAAQNQKTSEQQIIHLRGGVHVRDLAVVQVSSAFGDNPPTSRDRRYSAGCRHQVGEGGKAHRADGTAVGRGGGIDDSCADSPNFLPR